MASCRVFAYCVLFLVAGNSAIELRDGVTVQKLASDMQDAVSHILADFNLSTNDGHRRPNGTPADHWMLVLLKQQVDADEQLESATITKVASINDVTLTAELVALADGFHLVVSAGGDPKTENEQRATAVAIVSMLMSLSTMERVDGVLADCSLRSTVSEFFNSTNNTESRPVDNHQEKGAGAEDNVGVKAIEKLFAHWLQSVAAVLESEPHLSARFALLKNGAATELARRELVTVEPSVIADYVTQPRGGDAEEAAAEQKLAGRMSNSRVFRRAAVNRVFLRYASRQLELTEAEREHFLLARALIELATHHGEEARLNDLYQKVVMEVAEIIGGMDMEQMRDKLFSRLRSAIEEDADLREKVKMVERKLSLWMAFRTLRRNIALI